MDLNRLGLDRLNVEFKDMKPDQKTQRAFAEVILLERSHPNSAQMCFILKNDKVFSDADIEKFKQGHYNFENDDFLLIGEVISINKQQKYILLKNQNSISYNHLIIASGSSYSKTYEFIAGVNTLVDAIRVRKKIPSAFADTAKQGSGKRKMKSSKTHVDDLNFPKKIENVKSKKMTKAREGTSSNTLNNPNKRLYEVQI